MGIRSDLDGLNNQQVFLKRSFDVVVSFLGLLVLLPILGLAWVISSIETRSNGLFFQNRVGKDGNVFRVIKIKTMKEIAGVSTTITTERDVRITRCGKLFRKTKIDELPQLWNVFIGEMSFVGPRPDVPGYADKLLGEDRIILSVRPGITGPASLFYKNEEELLAQQTDPVKYNDDIVWPTKVRINKAYIENYSFRQDLIYIWKTLAG